MRKQILTFLVLLIGLSSFAQTPDTYNSLPPGFLPYGTQYYKNAEGTVIVGNSAGKFRVVTNKKSLDSLDAAVASKLSTKVDKISGKGLSTEDYTTAEKAKLSYQSGVNTGDQDLSPLATNSSLTSEINNRISADTTLQRNINKSLIKVSATLTATAGQTVFTFPELVGQFPFKVNRSGVVSYTRDVSNVSSDSLKRFSFNTATGAITLPTPLSAGEFVNVEYTGLGNPALVPSGIALTADLALKADIVNIEGKVIRADQVSTYTPAQVVAQFANGYYRYQDGQKSTSANRKTRLFKVTYGKSYRITGNVSGTATALVIYYSGTLTNPDSLTGLTYITYDLRGPSSGSTSYNRQTITPPVGTTYIGSSSVTEFPQLEDVVTEYPKTVYEISDDAGGKILRTPLQQYYVQKVPVQQFTNGFYSSSTLSPIPNTGSPRNSRLFEVDESKSYVLTGTSFTTSLAVYYDVNMHVIGSQYPSNGGYMTRTRVPLTLPQSTKFIGTSTASTRPFAELEEIAYKYRNDVGYSGNSTKTIEQLDLEKTSEIDSLNRKVARVPLYSSYTSVAATSTASGGFYNTTGGYSTSASRRTNLFPVSDAKSYVISGSVLNPTYLALYYSGTPTNPPNTDGLTILGGQQFNTSGTYTRQVLTLPAGTTYIGSNTGGGAVLEEVTTGYREDLMIRGDGFNMTGKELYDAVIGGGSGSFKIDNVMFLGDSKVQFPESYSHVLPGLLGATSVHNLAVPGARMSKTSQFSPDYPIAPTQNYDDPGWLGVTSSPPNTSMTTDQLIKVANNWIGYQVQRGIKEVDDGTYPEPQVIYLDGGTNSDYRNGRPSVDYGTVDGAMVGKTIHRDSTFRFAEALRYSIQELTRRFPNALLIVSTICQRGDPSYNASFHVPKNAIIKGICAALAVPCWDAASLSGITEKNEVAGGMGKYLKDGTHYNYDGGKQVARQLYPFTKSLWAPVPE